MPPFNPTEEQQAILGYRPDRHARILAGPGTGKSATVVKLVDQLLSNDPPKLRLLTFTRAATGELAAKVSEHPAAAALRPSTIHSFAIAVLLQNVDATELPMPLRIADDWERKKIVNPSLGRRIGVQPRRIDDLFRELAANWESLRPGENARVHAEDRARFLGGWAEHRGIFGYTMLSELPFALREAVRNHDDLEGVDFDLLVVDEYQDLNACDLEVLRLLSQRGCRIIAVGDDDQSIYSFRNAAPEGIRRFPNDYPVHVDYPLSITHRCGNRQVAWARHVIEGDPNRERNRPRLTAAAAAPDGEVALLSFRGANQEVAGIAYIVENLITRENLRPADILILLRGDHNNAWSTPIKEALADKGIACTDPDRVGEILAVPTNRRLLALFRLSVDRTDSLAWATLFELEPGIGDGFVTAVYEAARLSRKRFGQVVVEARENDFVEFSPRNRTRAQVVVRQVLGWLEAHPVLNAPPDGGWGHWILEVAGVGAAPGPTQEMADLLIAVDGVAAVGESFDRYLGQVTPLARDLAQSRSDGVRIMTMAASKGLTVEAAILPGLEEGVIPRPDADRDEERRLLYVAMTRGKRFLFCTWAQRRQGPTARSGQARVQLRRSYSNFLRGGPVQSEAGAEYIARRWPRR